MKDILFILFPLVITLSIETGIYMILKHRDMKLFVVVSLMNVVLNISMNIVLTKCIHGEFYYYLFLVIFEIATTMIESLIVWFFMKFKYLKTLLFAAIANAASLAVGLSLSFAYDTKITIIVLTSLFFAIYLATYIVVLVSFCKQLRKES